MMEENDNEDTDKGVLTDINFFNESIFLKIDRSFKDDAAQK